MRAATAKARQTLIDGALRGELTEAQAKRLYHLGPEAVILALLATSRRIAQLQSKVPVSGISPSTPSGMVPVYATPNKPKRRK